MVYAIAVWTCEVAPFREVGRAHLARGGAILIVAVLVTLAVGVIADARAARPSLLFLPVAAYGIAWIATRRVVASGGPAARAPAKLPITTAVPS